MVDREDVFRYTVDMKNIFTVFILLCAILARPALAGDPWSDADVKREIAYLAVDSVDWGQTLYTARHPTLAHENNPLLGRHPSVAEVNRYFVLTMAAHVAITNAIPSRWRERWQITSIVWEFAITSDNTYANIRVQW